MKQALCALLAAALIGFPALMLPVSATVESEPMNSQIQDGEEDEDSSSSEDEDSSSSEDEDNSSSEDEDDEDNSSSEDEDEDGSSSEDEDEDNSSSEDEDEDGSSSEDEEDPEEKAPWWWDEEIDGVWYPGAENTPTISDETPAENVMLPQVVLGDQTIEPNPVRAHVTALVEDTGLADELFPGRSEQSLVFEAQVDNGEFAGTAVSAVQHLDEAMAAYGRIAAVGDEIYLTLYRDEAGTLRGEWSDFRRAPPLLWGLAAAAILLLLCTRRWGGFKLLFALSAAGLIVFKGYPALIRAGMNAHAAAFLASAALVLAACPILYGIKCRTLAAALSSLLSVSIVGLLFYATEPLFKLTGIANPGLVRAGFEQGLDLHLTAGLEAAAMLCAAGAVLAASNAAAAGAEPTGAEELTARQVYLRGYRSGSSALAPIAMALAFFSLGLLFALVLPLVFAGFPAGRILSDELFTVEAMRLIAGLLGLMISVPITSALCALLLPLRRRPDGTLRDFHVREALAARQQKLFGRVAAGIDNATQSIAGQTDAIDEKQEEQEKTE
ncbi:MAG: hypothetical protein HFG26_03085 [Provencibacterium sp.]|jgi:uncharacterized membrane protein|nr:hypothetical protein [Provencibacterium sp.]